MTGQMIGYAIGQDDEPRLVHPPSRSNNPAAAMIIKRLGAVGALLCLAAMLGGCSPFAGYMADHWPHWAGGLPADAPPRPGAPGYDEFIAHGEPAQNAQGPESGAAGPANGSTGAIPPGSTATASAPQFQARNSKAQQSKAAPSKAQPSRAHAAPAQASAQREPAAKPPAEPVEAPSAEDPSVVKGGLY
jgi:hypothetical protein